jgi:HD domain
MGLGLYRVWQAFRDALAFAQPIDQDLLEQFLSVDQQEVFQQLGRGEQLHAIRVLGAVLAEGETPPALAQAALLHDIGKIQYPMNLWQRSLPVLVGAISPKLLKALSQRNPNHPLMRGFVVYVNHPAWSGEILRYAHSDDAVIWLAQHHADDAQQWRSHPLHALLVRLQRADNNN